MSTIADRGAALELKSGKHAVNANFSMSSSWKLTVYVRHDAGLDYKDDIEFKVQ